MAWGTGAFTLSEREGTGRFAAVGDMVQPNILTLVICGKQVTAEGGKLERKAESLPTH